MADKYAQQKGPESKLPNKEHNKNQAYAGGKEADEKGVLCVSKTVENAAHRDPEKKKGTQPSKGFDVNAGHLIMEYCLSDKTAEAVEEEGTGKTKEHT